MCAMLWSGMYMLGKEPFEIGSILNPTRYLKERKEGLSYSVVTWMKVKSLDFGPGLSDFTIRI